MANTHQEGIIENFNRRLRGMSSDEYARWLADTFVERCKVREIYMEGNNEANRPGTDDFSQVVAFHQHVDPFGTFTATLLNLPVEVITARYRKNEEAKRRLNYRGPSIVDVIGLCTLKGTAAAAEDDRLSLEPETNSQNPQLPPPPRPSSSSPLPPPPLPPPSPSPLSRPSSSADFIATTEVVAAVVHEEEVKNRDGGNDVFLMDEGYYSELAATPLVATTAPVMEEEDCLDDLDDFSLPSLGPYEATEEDNSDAENIMRDILAAQSPISPPPPSPSSIIAVCGCCEALVSHHDDHHPLLPLKNEMKPEDDQKPKILPAIDNLLPLPCKREDEEETTTMSAATTTTSSPHPNNSPGGSSRHAIPSIRPLQQHDDDGTPRGEIATILRALDLSCGAEEFQMAPLLVYSLFAAFKQIHEDAEGYIVEACLFENLAPENMYGRVKMSLPYDHIRHCAFAIGTIMQQPPLTEPRMTRCWALLEAANVWLYTSKGDYIYVVPLREMSRELFCFGVVVNKHVVLKGRLSKTHMTMARTLMYGYYCLHYHDALRSGTTTAAASN